MGSTILNIHVWRKSRKGELCNKVYERGTDLDPGSWPYHVQALANITVIRNITFTAPQALSGSVNRYQLQNARPGARVAA